MIADELKRYALTVGADLVGIAPAIPLPEAQAYGSWVDQGMQGSMDYMARNKESRQDITHWYPEAKSILICGFNYSNSQPPTQDSSSVGRLPTDSGSGTSSPYGSVGRLARYAVLPDYHAKLKEKMEAVLEWFKQSSPGSAGKVFVDTSPLLERLYGRYAGIGWVGKNTMLIAPRLGSYFFITGIALNQILDHDDPVPDHCGTCNRCLKACPTEAFPQERVLDASRCIAYFTIEHRGAIPEEFRPGIGNWVMGCDICQEVCPWNRFSLPGRTFEPILDSQIPLEELACLDENEFKNRFRQTPLARAKRRGIVRNALLAMGNSKDPSFRPILRSYAQDQDPILREQASWSLSRLPPETQS